MLIVRGLPSLAKGAGLRTIFKGLYIISVIKLGLIYTTLRNLNM